MTRSRRSSNGFARDSAASTRSIGPPRRATSSSSTTRAPSTARCSREAPARTASVELGSERLLPGFERGSPGARAGEEQDLDVTFPDDYGAEDLAGKAAVFKVKVKEVREKELPELDDDFAQSASEFDTLDELREEIRSRMAEVLEQRSDMEFRDAAVDAAVAERDRRPAARPRPRPGARNVGALRADRSRPAASIRRCTRRCRARTATR